MIRIAAEDWAPLDRGAAVDEHAWIVFTSANAADRLCSGCIAVVTSGAKGVSLCAVGPSTRDRLLRYGVRGSGARRFPGGCGGRARERGPAEGRKFLLPMADVGRELAPGAADAGARRWMRCRLRTLPRIDPVNDPDVIGCADRQIDAVTFTSAASVRNFRTPSAPSRRTCSSRPWSRWRA
jgi:uroporphyrinogen III methyltransferase/synthase